MRIPVVVLIFLAATTATAQWQLQDSHSKASFRGVHSLGGGVAWVSGTEGTVLRTEDGGVTWQHCAVPPGAEQLDFRGVQGFDANTAIVMSSGKGDLSRLYKTTDGCQTWKLVFANPDADGFWDAVVVNNNNGVLIGDPVRQRFAIFGSVDGNFEQWQRLGEVSDLNHFRIDFGPYDGEGLFAASNSTLEGDPLTGVAFVTGGPKGAFFGFATWRAKGFGGFPSASMGKVAIPLAAGVGGGAFSFAGASTPGLKLSGHYVAVGGDYTKPDVSVGTAAFSRDGGAHWRPSYSNPHGFRSAVAYNATTKTWITVGPNGTDISSDDGRNWRALKPGPNDAADADKNWNALSLPFVVGPHGRIGVLRWSAISAK